MDILKQEDDQRQVLIGILDQLATLDAKELVRKQELGPLSFEDGTRLFVRVLEFFAGLRSSDLTKLPFNKLKELTNSATHALNAFQEILNFSLKDHSENPVKVRDELIGKVFAQFNNYFKNDAPVLGYLMQTEKDSDVLQEKARAALQEIDEMRRTIKEEKQQATEEMSSIMESIRSAAAEAGVSQHAKHFEAEARQQETDAKKWLEATVWVAIGTFGLAALSVTAYLLKWLSVPKELIIQLAVAKVVLFSVLYFVIVWCGRNYKAHKHNYTVNKHRQNALATFQAFVSGTDDEAIKDAVLLRATEAIFHPSPSGYLSREPDGTLGSRVLEVMQKTSSRSGNP